jgi:hypothetical protein
MATELKHGGGYSQQNKGEQKFNFYFWVSSDDTNMDYNKYVKNIDITSEPKCGPFVKK